MSVSSYKLANDIFDEHHMIWQLEYRFLIKELSKLMNQLTNRWVDWSEPTIQVLICWWFIYKYMFVYKFIWIWRVAWSFVMMQLAKILIEYIQRLDQCCQWEYVYSFTRYSFCGEFLLSPKQFSSALFENQHSLFLFCNILSSSRVLVLVLLCKFSRTTKKPTLGN